MVDYSKKSDKDLEKMLREEQESLRVFRFNISGSKTRNVREGRDIRRKKIARILTELNSRRKQHHG
jgi:ribosomal protein L29